MKISPYANVSDMLNDAQTILSNKKLWTDAKDDDTRENIRYQTEPIYERLRRNGYGDVAKNLTDSNYDQAVSVVNALSKNNEPLRKVTYTPESDIENIYNNKERWGNTTDEKEKNNIAAQTQAYYNSLKENGYNDEAHTLSQSNLEQAKTIRDKWAKMGKTEIRNFAEALGKAKGLSREDIDKLVTIDDATQQVYFGGQLIGTPDAVVDGVYYFGEDSLKNAEKTINDYFNKSGTTVSPEILMGQNNAGVKDKIDEYWGTIKGDRDKYYSEYDKVSDYANRDVTKTDEYQSTFKNIMGKYDLSAMQGRDNVVASGGASNGGNIDSYAAANAMRQQAAITTQGQALAHQLGLEAYQSRMDNTRQLLSDLGIYQKDSWGAMNDAIETQQTEAQRLFENDQTAKNNEVARLAEQANITGYTPNEWVIKNNDTFNQFLNPDGSFKKEMEGVDIQALINQAKARGDTKTANDLAVVRARKMLSDYSKYGKYLNDGDVAFMQPQQIEAGRQFDTSADLTKHEINTNAEVNKYNTDASERMNKYNTDASERMNTYNSDATERMNTANNKNTIDQIKAAGKNGLTVSGSGTVKTNGSTLTGEQAKKAIMSGEVTEGTIAAYNKAYDTSYTVDNPPKFDEDGKLIPTILTDAQVESWVDKLNTAVAKEFGSEFKAVESKGDGEYKSVSIADEYIIKRVLESDDLTDEQKKYLLVDRFGISLNTINNMLKDPHYK